MRPLRCRLPETNDLIYEGIATRQIVTVFPAPVAAETNDLIYEGIATPPVDASFICLLGAAETNDLIYEGIATNSVASTSRYSMRSETNDLIYEGIATMRIFCRI